MENRKGPFTVKELKGFEPGLQIWGKYLIIDKIVRKTKDGRNVINLKAGDSTGEIDVVVWDNCTVQGNMELGMVIGLLGDMGSYNNKIQITAKRIKLLPEEEVDSYLKQAEANLDELNAEFNTVMDSIGDSYLNTLLKTIFTEEKKEKFVKATAAKKVHHNYRGGLLEHTLGVARLCERICTFYPYLNRDLLITGAILHDIGKMEELKIGAVADYTIPGKLLGHIFLGTELVSEHIKTIRQQNGEFPEKLEFMIKHMLLSHHGSLEYGSPVIPLFPEAYVLHMADNLDAKLFIFANKINDENDGDSYFTSYDTFMEQQFYKERYNGNEHG